MQKYNHLKIEKKWQKIWDKTMPWKAQFPSKKKKFYGLIEFPYPSGEGLHVGHIRSNTAMDIITRKRRAEGFNVLYPIGWDAFGLPTENYAIKTGKPPALVTKQNTDNFRRQLKSLGFSFDWSREINTTDPKYYKWTQWMFLLFFKNGLAYKAKSEINWCPSCKIGLANEEAMGGVCERCDGKTEKREKEQWMLAITKYADRLDKDLDSVDYPDRIKIQQRNWIGKSDGAEIRFQLVASRTDADLTRKSAEKIQQQSVASVEVFTTRPDTLFGATYLVLAPEHELVQKLKGQIKNWPEVVRYIEQSKKKTEIERIDEKKEKTGIKLEGIEAANPANNERIPIYAADYILAHYGTGAIMAVPAHDERDFEFAQKFNLPIKMVVCPNYPDPTCPVLDKAYEGTGCLVDSGKFDGRESEKAKSEIIKFVGGKTKTTYKLRDWVFSRQRYWGEPIPIINCKKCGFVPVPEKNLPVVLPKIKNYKPTDTGESPLETIKSWVNVKCPKCKGLAKRETDTMPTWAGSSWYFLRYTDPKNNKEFASKKNLKYFTPVDWYNGGMEHTTLHLLYSRFWHKFLYDLKLVPTKEPYKKRTSHGLILAGGGVKMSKSKGNVINPDEFVKLVGADSLRLYEMFMGPFEQAISWSQDGVVGTRRFLEKVWRLQSQLTTDNSQPANKGLETLMHQTIKKVSEDIENLKMNTAISQMMILVNEMEKQTTIPEDYFKILLRLLAPFAPHIGEEIWQNLGEKKSIHFFPWPKWQKNKIVEKTIVVAVSINGKVRGQIKVNREADEAEVATLASLDKDIKKWITGPIKRQVYVPRRLINFLV